MITNMNHITLAVKDIETSFNFYRDIVGLIPLVKWDEGAYFLAGVDGLWFCLNVDPTRIPNPCYTHYAFTVSDFEGAVGRIMASGAVIFKDNTSPGESLYFLDPDGHKLEIHTGRWQTRVETKKANLGSWKNVEWFV